jgi:hypothetical protein
MAQRNQPQAETLSGSPQPNFVGFQLSTILSKRDPTSADKGYPLGQPWVNKVANNYWALLSVSAGLANWAQLSMGASGPLDQLTGTTGTALPSGGSIQIAGTAAQITTVGTGSTITLSLPSAITAPGSLTTTTTLHSNTATSAATTVTAGTGLIATTGGVTATAGNLSLNGVGSKLVIHASTPASDSVGTSVAMTAGSVTVATTAVTAASKIFVTPATPGGTQGNLSIGTVTAGVSFVINSDSGTDTSTVNYLIIN